MATKRGQERKAQLINSALKLLENTTLDKISLQLIAECADIPVSSAYHFFKNSNDVFHACAKKFGTELIETLAGDYPAEHRQCWQDVYRTAVDRAVMLYNEMPAYCELILGPNTPASIKFSDRANDAELGAHFIDVLDRYFVVFRPPEISNRMFYSIEIVDLFLSLSYAYHNRLMPEIVEEAKEAGLAYLERYIPPILPKRV